MDFLNKLFVKDPLKHGKDLLSKVEKRGTDDPKVANLLREAGLYFEEMSQNPEVPDAVIEQQKRLAGLHFKAGNYSNAFELYEKIKEPESAFDTLEVWAKNGHPTKKNIEKVLNTNYNNSEIERIGEIFLDNNRFDAAIICYRYTQNVAGLEEIQKKALESGYTRWAVDIKETDEIPISFESGKEAAINLINDSGDFKGAYKIAKAVGSDELFDIVVDASKQKIDDTLENLPKNPNMSQTAALYLRTIIGMYPHIKKDYLQSTMKKVIGHDKIFGGFETTNVRSTAAFVMDDRELLQEVVSYAIKNPAIGTSIYAEIRTGTTAEDMGALIPQMEDIAEKYKACKDQTSSVEDKLLVSPDLFFRLAEDYTAPQPEMSFYSKSINGIVAAIEELGKEQTDKKEQLYATLRETVNDIYAQHS